MKYIDLHVHSTASDGSLTPEEVVQLAVESQLSAFALTDHDTLAGIKAAQVAAEQAAEKGNSIEVIPGTEISAAYDKKDIHILGLFIDSDNQVLNKELNNARLERDRRNEKMASNLQKAGIDITVEKMREVDRDAVLTRAHFAKYMVAHGYVKTNQDAFTKYLNSDSSYYVPREYLKPEEAIGLIHQAGGLAILAHPLLYKYSLEGVEKLVAYLVDFDLDGLEVIYSANMGFDEGRLRHIANKYNLAITGGSDFHGAAKPHIKLGVGKGNIRVPYSILEDLKEKLNKRI
ncbi:PHP domain-containing protein [Anaerocolumna aminovalerica]|uniref:PHP domain-containing protein n=1 Tax=Anaerocolumna aminovalerica TaxID=1527 RepID=UPI001C0EECEF|nr:PHP domain-containing protein [Anaerocolumna aminovalerica]MBU5331672.1 PHP domain-containing protein [Anaerocolumna aminovalerica]